MSVFVFKKLAFIQQRFAKLIETVIVKMFENIYILDKCCCFYFLFINELQKRIMVNTDMDQKTLQLLHDISTDH